MKSFRVLFVVLGLSALPLLAVAAQGNNGNGNGNQCKTAPSSPNGRGVGLATAPGQVKKCPAPQVAPPPNKPPVASFTFSCSDLSCSFTSTSSDPDGTISAYSWSFGDGGTSNAQNPSHSYGAAGSYPVSLTVTDNQGAASGPLSQTVNVTSPPPSSPPTGDNSAIGMVFEDINGDGSRDPFSGEMGLAGWQVQLIWSVNGQVIATSTTDANGNFQFVGIGNSSYSICVVGQAGYTQTYPVNLFPNCGGMGYDFSPNTTIPQQFQGDFGMKLQ